MVRRQYSFAIFQSKGGISEVVDKRIKMHEIKYERNHITSIVYLEATGLERQNLKCCITSGIHEYCEDEIFIKFTGKYLSEIVTSI